MRSQTSADKAAKRWLRRGMAAAVITGPLMVEMIAHRKVRVLIHVKRKQERSEIQFRTLLPSLRRQKIVGRAFAFTLTQINTLLSRTFKIEYGKSSRA